MTTEAQNQSSEGNAEKAGGASNSGSVKNPKDRKSGAGNRILLKVGMIGLLILILLVPTTLIMGLVEERADRQQEVIREVSEKWADAQTITGPVVMVPYLVREQQAKGKTSLRKEQAYFLPSRLSINGRLLPEIRHRSLYEVSLYRADLKIEGAFSAANFKAFRIQPEQILWQEAQLLFGLDDIAGLEEEVHVNWNGQKQTLEAGVPPNDAVPLGLSTGIPDFDGAAGTFSLRLRIKGSEHLYFKPVGKTTTVQLQSSWANPAFDGRFLPNASEISDSGFSANWKIVQASRPYRQAWTGAEQSLKEYAFGVKLLQPTDTYQKTERSVKYALLFITLTFGVFFLVEVLQSRQIHPLQYLLVGFALIVFYTLLLSFSEYIGFNPAYAIAAVATVGLIGWYTGTIFKKKKIALGFTLALSSLYVYIFFLIQLQDYALLFGSIGLFLIVALAMYSSRKIDWYGTDKAVFKTGVAEQEAD